MGLRVLEGRDGRSAVYDSVTEVPLPLYMFPTRECAEHFLLWARQNDREPYGVQRTAYYDHSALAKAFVEWHEKYVDPQTDDLTDEGMGELMAEQFPGYNRDE